MKKKTIAKRKLHKDCWSLDWAFIKWLNSHLKIYLHDADKFIDLTFHKFEYQNQLLTEKEIVEKMIQISDSLLNEGWYFFKDDEVLEKVNELLDLFKLVLPALWW